MVWLIVACVAAGILGGMGMGGGTLFIPLLTHAFGVSQHLAQWCNLVAFVPMAVVSLVIHAKNKLLDKGCFWLLVLPSSLSCAAFSLLAIHTSGKTLSFVFALFLLLVGSVGMGSTLRALWRYRKSKTPQEPPEK